MENSVANIIRKAEADFSSGSTQISEYVSFSLKETLDTIEAYIGSKHISGPTDTLGREKPFFNIVSAAKNIWLRATDIDRKNVKVKAGKEAHFMLAFLASIHLQEWMKKTNFGAFLNEWGRTLATYGSAVVKFVEKDGELNSEVVPWNRLIVDAVDFENNPVIEKLYFTPVQLRKNESFNQEMVESLIESSKSPRKNWGGQQKDNKSDYIPVYYLHGELSQAQYNEAKGLKDKEGDDKIFFDQMHVLSFTGNKTKGHNDYTLYSGKEKKSPYLLTHLIKEDGLVLGIGAVEHLFEAQWMVNHSAKLIKDQLDLASKIIFQTSDANFIGKNALTQIENGEILTYQVNQPLTQLNNKPDIAAMQSFGQQWETGGNRIVGISESMFGDTAPSGTAWRQVQTLLQESHSLFKLMRQNKAFHIEEMLNEFISDHIKSKMDTTDEIAATLESYQIKQIDRAFIPGEAIRVANEQIKSDIMAGKMTQAPDMMAIESQIQAKLNEKGNQRFIAPSDISTKRWKDVFKGFKFLFECDPTDEQKDNQAVMATYDTALKFIIGLQGRQMTPVEEYLFNGLISQTGHLSPVELSNLNANTPQLPQGQMGQMNPAQSVGQPVAVGAGMNNLATNK